MKLVLLSGGLDSVVACAGESLRGRAAAVTFDYGQAAFDREADAAREVSSAVGVEHRVVALEFLRGLCPDAMRGKDAGEDGSFWVPARNLVFAAVGAAFAEAGGAEAVVAGFNAEEGRAFPDNTAEFLRLADGAVKLGTRGRVRIESPTSGLSKAEIVRLGVETNAPLEHVWSCYYGGDRMCGDCPSCRRLLRALEEGACPPEKRPRLLP